MRRHLTAWDAHGAALGRHAPLRAVLERTSLDIELSTLRGAYDERLGCHAQPAALIYLPFLAHVTRLLTAFGLLRGALERSQPKARPQSVSCFWLCVKYDDSAASAPVMPPCPSAPQTTAVRVDKQSTL